MLLASAAYANDAARVEEIVQGKCFICHGPNGESSTPTFPRPRKATAVASRSIPRGAPIRSISAACARSTQT